MLKVGDKLTAKRTENFPDFVTKNKVYEVCEVVQDHWFYITNDKDEKCFPLLASFKRESDD